MNFITGDPPQDMNIPDREHLAEHFKRFSLTNNIKDLEDLNERYPEDENSKIDLRDHPDHPDHPQHWSVDRVVDWLHTADFDFAIELFKG